MKSWRPCPSGRFARCADSHLRFDFNQPEAMTPEQIERVEKMVNEAIAADMPVVKADQVSRRSQERRRDGLVW